MSNMNAEPTIHRLVYASVAHPDLKLSELDSVIRVSERNNARDGVSGALICAEGCFLQILEGNRRQLSHTFARILRDERHSHVCLIEFAESEERQFSTWAMRHLSFQPDQLHKAVGMREFDPLNWTAKQCYAFFLRYSLLVSDL